MRGMEQNDLLREIDGFLAERKMSDSYFGKLACGNTEVVKRLRGDGSVTLKTAQRIRAFISTKRQERAQ
jgi:hypothetical protein